MDDKAKNVLNRLEALCSRREYCSSEIMAKALKALDSDTEAASELVSVLVKDGFVSDLRYATAFARDKSSLTGWGPIKIRYALSAKKIDRETIDAALSDTDSEKAQEKLEKLILAKKKTLEGDPQARLKLIKFALSRGYEYDQVRKLVG